MPELPDVEIFRRYFLSTSLHKKIRAVDIKSRDMLKEVSAEKIKSTLERNSFMSALRHGKYLFMETERDEKWLVLHFGMTGFLKYYKDLDHRPGHERLLVYFSNGYHLAYDCQRKLGTISLTDSPDAFIKKRQLGPDALNPDYSLESFAEDFRKIRGKIKSALMKQKYIAGIGNIYSDEILFQAGIHPGVQSSRLKKKDMENIYRQMNHVLKTAIEAHADPGRLPSSFIIPHRQEGDICPKCKAGIEKEKIGGRTAYYCPQCQKK